MIDLLRPIFIFVLPIELTLDLLMKVLASTALYKRGLGNLIKIHLIFLHLFKRNKAGQFFTSVSRSAFSCTSDGVLHNNNKTFEEN